MDQIDGRELQALRRALGDMAALSSLPAMWVNADEERIAESLADALVRVLDLDGVRVAFSPQSGETLEVNRLPGTTRDDLAHLLEVAFPEPGAGAARDLTPDGGLRGYSTAIGVAGAGRLDAVCSRRSFPTQAEHLALTMAANQVAVAWQRARAERNLRAKTEALNQERRAVEALNRQLGGERDKLQRLFEQAPGFMAMMRGPEHVFELCNQSYLRLSGRRDIVGRPVREVFPEVEGQGFFELLDQAYATGTPHVSTAAPIDLQREPGESLERRYLDFIYQPIFDDDGQVTGVFAEGHDVTEQVQSQAQLALNEESLRLATSAAGVGIWDLDLTTDQLTWCDRTKAMFGISPDVACSMADFYAGLHPDDADATSAAFTSALDPERRAIYDVEYRTIGKEDEIIRWVAAKGKGLFDGERCIRAIGTAIDITARKASEYALRQAEKELREEIAQRKATEGKLQQLNLHLEDRIAEEVAQRGQAEEALRQAQKMEAVGQLTGGVAHDFNNLLTVIIGGLDTIRRSQPGDEIRVQRAAEMSLQGAERAASLTARLLAFSRRQPLTPQPTDLNLAIRKMTDLFHRTLGETIELEGILSPRLWTVDVDQNQLESAILNLGINSRDAMPNGGLLTIETANVDLDERYAATDAEVVPGQYVMVSVSDTGVGMDKETLHRVFEPFFTTKEVGKGTGLGLSMVYGFVKQSGGHVTIYSEPAAGTSVKLYFPRYRGPASVGEEIRARHAPRGHGEEVILVVEDNADVRSYSISVLGELGYSVLEAEHPDAALKILQGPDRIDLLFTDVVLPGRSGRELAGLARELRPDLRVLFTTGYSRNAIVHQGRLDAGVQLISKPFTFEGLAARVRDVLDASRID